MKTHIWIFNLLWALGVRGNTKKKFSLKKTNSFINSYFNLDQTSVFL